MTLGAEHSMCCQNSYSQSGMYSPKRLQNFALKSVKMFPLATIMKLELSHKHRNIS